MNVISVNLNLFEVIKLSLDFMWNGKNKCSIIIYENTFIVNLDEIKK
jgi:uncharacterized membrane protein